MRATKVTKQTHSLQLGDVVRDTNESLRAPPELSDGHGGVLGAVGEGVDELADEGVNLDPLRCTDRARAIENWMKSEERGKRDGTDE